MACHLLIEICEIFRSAHIVRIYLRIRSVVLAPIGLYILNSQQERKKENVSMPEWQLNTLPHIYAIIVCIYNMLRNFTQCVLAVCTASKREEDNIEKALSITKTWRMLIGSTARYGTSSSSSKIRNCPKKLEVFFENKKFSYKIRNIPPKLEMFYQN